MSSKKIIWALLCICLAVGIMLFAASCNIQEKPTEAPTQEQTEAPTEDSTEPPVPKITYTVTVEDFHGNKASGVTIEIYQGETCVASGETDSNGKFTAELVQADDYTAKISKAHGYVFDDEVLEFENKTKLEFTVEEAVEYKITVFDQFTEQAISGVTVELYTSSGALAASGIVDENGVASIWAIERSYTVVIANAPEKYPNDDTYLLESNEYEKTIYLADPADYEANGSREEAPLIVFNRESVTVEAGKTLYCRSTRTPGFVLTIANGAENIKVIYGGKEYFSENGALTLQFTPQLDEKGNPIDIYYAQPNDFAIVNTGSSSATVKLSIVDANDALGTASNPFELSIGTETVTPEFILGTSLANPGISRYCYIFDATESGFFWVDSLDAAVCIYINGVVVQDDEYNQLPYAFLSAGDKVDVHIESLNLLDDLTLPVRFTAGFDSKITVLPDKFTCEHQYDNNCDKECNKCESIRRVIHTEEEIPAVDPTCSKAGLTVGVKCSVCGEIIVSQQETDTIPHTPKTVAGRNPDCTNTGLTNGKICSVCGAIVEEQKIIDALGHEWSSVYEHNEETHWQTCIKCPDITSEPEKHKCNEKGWCVCGYGCSHNIVEWKVTKEATCLEKGIYSLICSDCGAATESKIIETTDHTPGEKETCTTDQICTVCKDVLVEAFGHTPGEKATCKTDQICTVCKDVLVEAFGHTPGDKATCKTDQICTVCKDVIKEAGHTPNREEATCNYQKICIECFVTLESFKPHTPGAAATCAAAQTCTSCGYELVEALPHSYADFVCTVCGYEKPENTYKITIVNASDGKPLANVTLKFYDFETEELFHTATTDENGYVAFTTREASTAVVQLADLPEGYLNDETYLVGEESAFGFEYTIKLMNASDYVYDGRDEEHSYNIPGNNGIVTVAASSTIYCMYPKSAGMTMTIKNAKGVKVVYNGVEYTANSSGVITVKFASQGGSIEYSEPNYFKIINTTGEDITLNPTVA